MTYFGKCATLDELKSEYRILAKLHHPDKGGSTQTMQEINTEYAIASARICRGESVSEEEIDENIAESIRYREVLEKIILLPNIVIDLVGTWIWVEGNTYAVKESLKSAGLFYASNKKAWYYRPEEYKCVRGSNLSLEQIRNKYGSVNISKSYQKTIK